MNDREWAQHLEQSRQLQAARDAAAKVERELKEIRRARRELTAAVRALLSVNGGSVAKRAEARTRAAGVLGAWGSDA